MPRSQRLSFHLLFAVVISWKENCLLWWFHKKEMVCLSDLIKRKFFIILIIIVISLWSYLFLMVIWWFHCASLGQISSLFYPWIQRRYKRQFQRNPTQFVHESAEQLPKKRRDKPPLIRRLINIVFPNDRAGHVSTTKHSLNILSFGLRTADGTTSAVKVASGNNNRKTRPDSSIKAPLVWTSSLWEIALSA